MRRQHPFPTLFRRCFHFGKCKSETKSTDHQAAQLLQAPGRHPRLPAADLCDHLRHRGLLRRGLRTQRDHAGGGAVQRHPADLQHRPDLQPVLLRQRGGRLCGLPAPLRLGEPGVGGPEGYARRPHPRHHRHRGQAVPRAPRGGLGADGGGGDLYVHRAADPGRQHHHPAAHQEPHRQR